MPQPNRIQKRLQVVLDRLTPQARKAILRALEQLQKAASVQKIVEAMERGDFWSFERLVAGLPKDLERASRALRQAFDAGVRAAKAEIGLSLAAPNTAAAAAAEVTAARFVTGVSRETRAAIRVAITRAFTEGVSVRDIAKQIKPLIGLTERQTKAVLNFRIKNAGAKDLNAKAAKYAEKLLRQRAEMIARTEVIKASTDGKIATWKAARTDGLLSPTLVKSWIVTPDDRLCPICEPLDGEQVPLDQPFHTSVGDVSGPPAHPNCRCAVGLVEAKKPARRAA